VLAVLDRQRVARRHEEEVERGDRADRGTDRGQPGQEIRRRDHREQVDHRLAHQRDHRVEDGADRRRCRQQGQVDDREAPGLGPVASIDGLIGRA
jgi:hypothetical protein